MINEIKKQPALFMFIVVVLVVNSIGIILNIPHMSNETNATAVVFLSFIVGAYIAILVAFLRGHVDLRRDK